MMRHTTLTPGMTVLLLWILILTAGCSRPTATDRSTAVTGQPSVQTADPCAIALTPHTPAPAEVASRPDQQIIRFQHAARQADNPMAYLEQLGWAFVAKARGSFDPGFYTLAEQSALCMAQTAPDSAEVLLLRGHVLNHMHRFREGEVLAQRLVAQRGLSYDYGLLGDLLMEQGKLTEAVAAYDDMLKQKPSPQGYIRAAHMRWLTGDLDGAIQLMRMATQGFRDAEASAWAHVRLALYEFQAGRMQQAANHLATAAAWRPDYPPALLAQGRLLLAEGQYERAATALTRAAARNPLPEYQWSLIEALHAAGREDEAGEVEQQLMLRGATDDRRTFALYLATTGHDPERAVQLAREELDVRRDVFTLDALAWALNAAGQPQEAHDVSTRALATGTQDARLFYHAGVIAASVGQPEEAARWFAKATAVQQMLLPSERAHLINTSATLPMPTSLSAND